MSFQFSFEAIGTHWVIDIYDPAPPDNLSEIEHAIARRIAEFDKNYSRFRQDSLVMEMSRTAGIYSLPDDAEPIFSLYRKLYDLTGGLLTPCIGKTMEDSGYDAEYSLVPKILRTPPSWDEAAVFDFIPNSSKVEIKQPVLFDIGAAGKGYLIDIVGSVLEEYNITSYCIDAGGDILHKNTQPLRVGLEHPDLIGHPNTMMGIVEMQNSSICGSAGNRRAWADFHHIINPHTLSSPRHILATWVIVADDSVLYHTTYPTMLADGLATSLFFTSPEVLLPHFNFEYCIVHADYSISKSSNFVLDK